MGSAAACPSLVCLLLLLAAAVMALAPLRYQLVLVLVRMGSTAACGSPLLLLLLAAAVLALFPVRSASDQLDQQLRVRVVLLVAQLVWVLVLALVLRSANDQLDQQLRVRVVLLLVPLVVAAPAAPHVAVLVRMVGAVRVTRVVSVGVNSQVAV